MRLPSLLLLFVLLAIPARAAPIVKTWNETQILTRAAPSTSSTEGFSLVGATAWRLEVCAPSGQALTGGAVWIWAQGSDGLWMDTPRLAAILTITSTGQRCQALGDFEVAVPINRLLPASRAITLSGAGTTVDMRARVTYR